MVELMTKKKVKEPKYSFVNEDVDGKAVSLDIPKLIAFLDARYQTALLAKVDAYEEIQAAFRKESLAESDKANKALIEWTRKRGFMELVWLVPWLAMWLLVAALIVQTIFGH
jgi:hypothetical protein